MTEFHTSFVLLIKDFEFEFNSILKNKRNIVEHLSKSTELPQSLKPIEKLSQNIKAKETFLNCHLLVSITEQLPKTIADKIHHYSNRINWFKTTIKAIYLHKRLQNYFETENSDSLKVTVELESAWSECSMWLVEQLITLTFSNVHIGEFQWFRVENSVSLVIVFLASKQLMTDLVENSTTKIEFMGLTGVICLQIGESTVLKRKADSSYSFSEGITQAQEKGNDEAFEFLLQINRAPLATQSMWDEDINHNYSFFPDSDSTALMIACCSNNIQLVKLLLENDADPNLKTSRKLTALMYGSGNTRIFKMLLNHNADADLINLHNENVLHWACYLGNAEVVKIILMAKNDSLREMRDGRGQTPLHIASNKGHLKIVNLLLQAHADPNVRDIDGATPLYSASLQGHIAIVRQLLEAHADPNIPTSQDQGRTPLYAATTKKYVQVVEQLLQAKANPNTQNKDGTTPLGIACHLGQIEIVKLLLLAKADPNIPNYNGRTPLYIASGKGYSHVVQKLLQAQADPDFQYKGGETSLYAASRLGHVIIVEQLLQANADPYLQKNDGATPLYIASKQGHLQIVERLLQVQAYPDIPDNNGKTALFAASDNGYPQVVQQLLYAKASPNIRNNQGETPLYVASKKGWVEIVEILLQAQADPSIKANDGKTPLDIAISNEHSIVAEKIYEAQADKL